MDIIKSNFGIANTYPDRIEINEKLYQPEFNLLREKIIKHELEHSKAKGFWKNRKIDVLTEVKFKDLIPFIKKNPKVLFQQYLPITYSKKKNTLYFEWSLIFLYSIITGLGFLVYYLINLFSTSQEMFWQIIRNTGIILGVVLVLYFIGKKFRSSTSKINWKEEDKKTKLTSYQKKLKKLGIKM